MSDDQRRQVGRHLRLVQLHLRRQPGVGRVGRADRDPQDLFQEGCLALMRAVRAYEPARHGPFAPYATARIHQAVGLALYERVGGIRVPMNTQRRRWRRAGRHDPAAPPRERRLRAGEQPQAPPRGSSERILAHLLRERYITLAHRAAAELRGERSGDPSAAVVIDLCLADRWLVSAPDCQTSFRDLARRAGCNLGRVVRCDARFRQLLSRRMAADPCCQWLARRAAASPLGLRDGCNEPEYAAYRALAAHEACPPR